LPDGQRQLEVRRLGSVGESSGIACRAPLRREILRRDCRA